MKVGYLFENCLLFLALTSPAFFLSTFLGSLVNKPAFFSCGLNSSSNKVNALDIPCRIAPA